MKVRVTIISIVLFLVATAVQGQITIGGNVYGGGNVGETGGNTNVTVYAGDLNKVYGGARQADVGGRTFVNIEGKHASDNIFINTVYGGNDIAGTIGTSTAPVKTVPSELTEVGTGAGQNAIDNTWDTFVRTSATPDVANRKSLVIGTLFGGGNGEYFYRDEGNTHEIYETESDFNSHLQPIASNSTGFSQPDLGKTYLEILGGCIAHLYGGGNNATVTANTTICIDNDSPVLTQTNVWPADPTPENLAALARKVGLSTYQSNLTSYDFNFARVFGGNNKAEMKIRPTWNLKDGVIRDLYSGGNQGRMTSPKGLLLDILAGSTITVENVYGGCRMADVRPMSNGVDVASNEIQLPEGTGYNFPEGMPARVVISGGDVNNVYGGNDITGRVWGGNAVGIRASIRGNVYGGGNGSYAYTDNSTLGAQEMYKDFYYTIPSGMSSVEALNAFRPNAESVSIRVVGQYKTDNDGKVIANSVVPTIIGGAIYCGGNSATIHNDNPNIDASAELKIGSYVYADKVFLGNNGVNMVTEDILKQYAGTLDGKDFSQMDLADGDTKDANGRTQFDRYMEGVMMDVMPRVVFDEVSDYEPYSTYFGSFYCGGNMGSMMFDGAININFNDKVVIFDKVVGGSNEANIYKTDYNAQHLGGVLGNPDANGNKLILNFGGLKIEPKRWNSTYAPLAEGEDFVEGNKYYTSTLGDGEFTATSTTTKEEGKTYYKMTDRGTDLVWNTVSAASGLNVTPITSGSGSSNAADLDRRLKGGNIYGGCYLRGHVEGNVVINLNESIHERNKLFDEASDEGETLYENVERGTYTITKRNTGVILSQQGMDVLGAALNVFGGGYGGDSEIWGSTTINLNNGYTFQIFGGGELGAIGQTDPSTSSSTLNYSYDPKYSTYINLNGSQAGVARGESGDSQDMAECEFIYGGGFEGVIAGDTHINLGNGRIFNSFAGSCNANILGHTETYIGRMPKYSSREIMGKLGITKESEEENSAYLIHKDDYYDPGFPYIRDHIYGGNDLGGSILGDADFRVRIREEVNGMVNDAYKEQVKKATSYIEYNQGRVRNILGGCFGDYEYTKTKVDGKEKISYEGQDVANKPYLHNAFVNFRPNTNGSNSVEKVFGAGEGAPGDRDGDMGQDHSYVLIDIPDNVDYKNFATTEVFGAGAYNGLGMRTKVLPQDAPAANATETELKAYADYQKSLNEVSAIIDLMRGRVGAVYGGSYEEGVTRRTMVNVPVRSTIKIGSIFGGAYGSNPYKPCDVYEANVNYLTQSENAYLISGSNQLLKGAIFGGNNYARRTLYGKINISAPVRMKHPDPIIGMTTATIYGAGCGALTWNEYTEVNLNTDASVWQVYGGGEAGSVMSAESTQEYITNHKPNDLSEEAWIAAWSLGGGYDPQKNDEVTLESLSGYAGHTYTNLNNPLVRTAEIDDRELTDAQKQRYEKKYNTNVIIHEGAYVGYYAYGGGLGKDGQSFEGSGDVYGTTYIALLGGKVEKDLYAAGTRGSVYNLFKTKNFIASANAYIKGGTVRNVYGGGWEGSVGLHTGTAADPNSTVGDIDGETHVIIGDIDGTTFTSGIPAIQRNAYGGGEGGAVYGTTNITVNNGYIGYVHLLDGQKQDEQGNIVAATGDGLVERYEEKIIDETYTDKETHLFIPNRNLDDAGNVFGGGYVDNSSVDKTNVKIYGGYIRTNAFGGGEIAAVGRGTITETTSGEDIIRSLSGLYRPGKAHIEMYGGHVYRNVYGGGRGYDNLGRYGKLHADGCVFGQTEVHIHGGEIGSAARLDYGDGNVFGGGDIGMVFSAYENADGTFGKGVKDGVRYDGNYQGYYYKHKWNGTAAADFILDGSERQFTEDCKVLIEPHCKSSAELSFTGIKYGKDQEVAAIDLDFLRSSDLSGSIDAHGIVTAVDGITFNRSYPAGSYVPTAALNTLSKKGADSRWDSLDPYGIVIHNAVFAGGNTPSGKSATNANVASVFGNATASINDVYHRDLISLGTNHQGGLYGDGNLTLVDGYRELNITNYGTDYYAIKEEIDIDQYKALPKREADYYELRFTCMENCTDKEGTAYKKSTTVGGSTTKASIITYDELLTLFLKEQKDDHGNIVYVEGTQTPVMESVKCNGIDVLKKVNNEWIPNSRIVDGKDKPYFWEESGVLPVYAGRPMNTIQRADFCGVWGSRMVMQGARDRVPDEADLTNYTINRVREVSLNAMQSVISSDAGTDAAKHGNYFGIYNIVNYLGALTSDVDFGGESTTNSYGDIRVTDNENRDLYGPDFDPAESTTISFAETVTTDEEKIAVVKKAKEIEGVTVSDETASAKITASTVEALYKLRAIPELVITGSRLTNQTYYDWKKLHHDERKRNNGNSHNKVALASGVYLEITTEESTGTDLYEKVWGPITGVIELDLINVQTGIGGGFVYAKNVHGVRTKTNYKNTTLTALNKGAVTHWDYTYAEPSTTSDAADPNQMEWETSGNFVHSTQTIIDDCYNISNKYLGTGRVPAHYWYIKGSVYVYDQYISAYTGSPNAFSEAVDIPLTITAASHGTMKLLDVKPNRYAYYSQPGVKLTDDKKISIGDKTYNLNDPISYWDWYLLTASERALFIENTYVNCVAVNIDNEKVDGEPKIYEPGTYVMTESEFNNFGTHIYKNAEGDVILDANKNTAGTNYIFRPSNDLGHDTGYILTYQVNNPSAWDTWYSPKTGISNDGKITKKVYDEKTPLQKDSYYDGPTYHLDPSKLSESAQGTVLGQSQYEVGDLISKTIQDTYSTIAAGNLPGGQATFKPAYILTKEVTITEGTGVNAVTRHMNAGATISQNQKDANSEVLSTANCDEAYICTKTIQLSKTDLIYRDTKMSEKQMKDDYLDPLYTDIRKILPSGTIDDTRLAAIRKIDDLTEAEKTALNLTEAQKSALKPLLDLKNEFSDYLVPAYYCTVAGLYGGNYYEKDKNYRGLEAWSSMSENDRKKFIFNYDALDLFIDPTYGVTKTDEGQTLQEEGKKYQYDGKGFTTKAQVLGGNQAKYSLDRALDYTATYKGTSDATPYNGIILEKNKEYTSEQYEKLPNEQRHYVAIHVKDGKLVEETTGEGESAVTTSSYKVYVVNKSFQIGNTPYAVGATISSETYLSLADQSNITVLTFPASEVNNTYYYCRESYNVGYNGSGTEVTHVSASVVTGTQGYDADGGKVPIKSEKYTNAQTVPIGLVVEESTYGVLESMNKQKNFTFHGISPTETSTLYVSRESDIYNLSKDKIITVIYQYDYEESDSHGNVTPVSERHVLNIHIKFESGVPTVEDITKPDIILPGDFITIGEPNVLPGAYEVTGGGWELFENSRDAESHTNGIDYNPTFDPLYWYQHDWYVAYYAKSYLGRTYSNAVPVSVANYHDLANVMSDGNKEHHMYIDNPNVKREPKIYINDYSESGKNGLDELKKLFDLSLVPRTYNDKGEPVAISGGTLNGHVPMDSHVKGGADLEFFLRSDIDHSVSWSSIGSAAQCFEGILHGDGHTISGLNNSLFGDLCGAVYNLGVEGTFTGAGIAETGSGYVENCWISNEPNVEKTSKPVFGTPNRDATQQAKYGKIQIVNCYYQEEANASDDYKYTNHSSSDGYGVATRKDAKAFYNGEVAYDLNGFYLNKRYYDKKRPSNKAYPYNYLIDVNGTLSETPQTSYYPASPDAQYGDIGYVEDRYADGDFIYANGTIPTEGNKRFYMPVSETGTETAGYYYPIWPDDYLFFGQRLNYGYDDVTGQPHQEHPSVILKGNDRVITSEEGNRVYRAPAYFRSSEMKVAHFNPYAIFAQHKKGDPTTIAYQDMTAIDFTGYNDVKYDYLLGWNKWSKTSQTAQNRNDATTLSNEEFFYPPLLDDGGLAYFKNVDLTQNLLVYTPSATENEMTNSIVKSCLFDPVYDQFYDNSEYRKVTVPPTNSIQGHTVVKSGSGYVAENDHFLVDKNDFNAPISYKFAGGTDGTRMWYQRTPADDEFVDLKKGWDAISLPFTAELVTTQDKGEITHFYDGSAVSKKGDAKIGHEYWLRQYSDIVAVENDATIKKAQMIYPSVAGGYPDGIVGEKMTKLVTNKFLWNYYYYGSSHMDRNEDFYQAYYQSNRTYTDYKMLTRATPYIIGFPGKTYYEFDLSGKFEPQNTYSRISMLLKQTITFASNPGITIGVSDEETKIYNNKEVGVKQGDYIFKPSYMNEKFKAEENSKYYTLHSNFNNSSSAYRKVPSSGDPTPQAAFRPFFMYEKSSAAGARGATRGDDAVAQYIIFDDDDSEIKKEQPIQEEDKLEDLIVNGGRKVVVVKSSLREETEVNIVNMAGITLANFTIQPGETVNTNITISGAYIVRTTDGRFIKKVLVY